MNLEDRIYASMGGRADLSPTVRRHMRRTAKRIVAMKVSVPERVRLPTIPRPIWPSRASNMRRALLICERLNPMYNGLDVEWVFQQLEHVTRIAAAPQEPT